MTPETHLNRRAMLGKLAGCAAVFAVPGSDAAVAAEDAPKKTGLGLVTYDCSIRRRWLRRTKPDFDLFEPLTFLKYCHQLGSGGMQAALGLLKPESIRALRNYADEHELFLDAIVKSPEDKTDLTQFEAEIQTAAKVGVQAARTVIMPGRRYEQFDSLDAFRTAVARGRRMLELAAPIVEKYRVRLAVENHKDQRIDERVALFKQIGSEFIGACVDTGNSFALLDDPIGTIEALAPYAFSVHLKDQAVREYEDGFLLGDIPLGGGCFDLKRMVQILRRAKPGIRFALELLTRDPLKVPCLTEKYWVTMPGVSGGDLVRMLQYVRRHRAKALQQVSSLSPEEQVKLEDANVRASLNYARDHLGL